MSFFINLSSFLFSVFIIDNIAAKKYNTKYRNGDFFHIKRMISSELHAPDFI